MGITKEISLDKLSEAITILNKLPKASSVKLSGFATTIAIKEELAPKYHYRMTTSPSIGKVLKQVMFLMPGRINNVLSCYEMDHYTNLPSNWLEENGSLVRELLLAKEKAETNCHRLPFST